MSSSKGTTGLLKNVELIRGMTSLSDSRKHFLSAVERSSLANHPRLEVVLAMAVILGGKDGESWFREAIPLKDRVVGMEKINLTKMSVKFKQMYQKAFLGASA